MSWLVTGGAGYIGSHVVQALLDADMVPIVLDDFSTGQETFVPIGVEVHEGTLLDQDFLREVFKKDFEGVVHLAGYKYAGESVSRPLHTYAQNVTGTLNILSAVENAKVENFVFSSSAAVYGTPQVERVTEETELSPESPYGESKLIGEWLVSNQAKASGLKATSLRYFNVVGSGLIQIPDLSPYNLFPLIFRALENGNVPHINGDDFPTPDGTCVRDYVHVADIARAHVSAARSLQAGIHLDKKYNLGAGVGTSVREIMNAASAVTGIRFTPEVRGRRPGDPAQIVADGTKAQIDLNWENTSTVDDMIETAWVAWNNWKS